MAKAKVKKKPVKKDKFADNSLKYITILEKEKEKK